MNFENLREDRMGNLKITLPSTKRYFKVFFVATFKICIIKAKRKAYLIYFTWRFKLKKVVDVILCVI